MATMKEDTLFMKQALELAAQGRGFTSPNPMVGAVVVRIIALTIGGGRPLGGARARMLGTESRTEHMRRLDRSSPGVPTDHCSS